MIIFIDESGDAGFKINAGSSSVFVVALVIFTHELDAEEATQKVRALKNLLKKSDNFEFKFNKCNRKLRMQFLKSVKSAKFGIRATVFKKENISNKLLKSSGEKFYYYAINRTLTNSRDYIRNAKIRLDGLGKKSFQRKLVSYLRKSLNTDGKTYIDNLKFRDSKTDLLIQLADMVAGAIHRFYTMKTDAEHYIEIIESKIESISF